MSDTKAKRGGRSVAWLLVLVLPILLLSFVGPAPIAPASASSHLSTASGSYSPPEQIIGIGTSYQTQSGTFWQNGSVEYESGATPFVFNPNFAGLGSLTYASLTVEGSVGNYLQPMLDVIQNGATLLNNTGTATFILYPPSDALPITTKIPEAFLPGGGIPSIGMYPANLTTEMIIEYQTSQPSGWSFYNNVNQESYQITAPAGVWLNSTVVYLPFPLPIQVNYTAANVTYEGSAYPYTQITSNGIYLNIPSVAPGTTQNFTAKYAPNPSQSGITPLIVIKNYTKNAAGVSPGYTAIGAWINSYVQLYGGVYIITLDIPYTIDPTTVNISWNGQFIQPSQFIVSGDVITILPLVVLTPLTDTAKFTIKFDLPGAPPSGSITRASSIPLLGFTFTLADFLWLLIVIGGVILFLLWVTPYRVKWRNKPERYTATYGVIVLMIICGVLLVLPQLG
jgi:hypothetical protein